MITSVSLCYWEAGSWACCTGADFVGFVGGHSDLHKGRSSRRGMCRALRSTAAVSLTHVLDVSPQTLTGDDLIVRPLNQLIVWTCTFFCTARLSQDLLRPCWHRKQRFPSVLHFSAFILLHCLDSLLNCSSSSSPLILCSTPKKMSRVRMYLLMYFHSMHQAEPLKKVHLTVFSGFSHLASTFSFSLFLNSYLLLLLSPTVSQLFPSPIECRQSFFRILSEAASVTPKLSITIKTRKIHLPILTKFHHFFLPCLSLLLL